MSLLEDLTTTAAIGPFDAARHLFRFIRARRLLENCLKSNRPDLAILVDFGDFNLPFIAPLVKRYGVPILYYISPQVWAWGRWRIRYIRRYIDRMLVLFRFEEAFYQKANIPVTWIGHPMIEKARSTLTKDEARSRYNLNPWRVTVGLLPGSRNDEIRRHLPLLLDAARVISHHMPGVQYLLPQPAHIAREPMAAQILRSKLEVHIANGSIYEALQLMEAAIVTSGTATLEAAICDVPFAAVYRTSWPTYLMGRSVIRIPHIAMVNVVAKRAIVPEFVQHRARPARIAHAVIELLRNPERRDAMQAGLREVTERLGKPGAVDRAADVVLEFLTSRRLA